MTGHNCNQHEKFEEAALFRGEVREAVQTIKKDMDTLFEMFRELTEAQAELTNSITKSFANNKIKLSEMKLKITAIIGVGLVFGQFAIKYLGGLIK